MLLFAALLAAAPMTAPAPAPAAAPDTEAERRVHQDWPWLARYRDANAALPPRAKGETRVVFMGDSITQGWYDLHRPFFTPGRIGRGIGGQTTPQMLVRFRQDVIDLHPDVVQIMAGTNDIAGNTGPTTDADTRANIMSMTELAQAHGIRVILASIPPADIYPWRPGLETGAHIQRLNTWLKGYAARAGATYADYWNALLAPGTLGMREGLAKDHVHPTVAGYSVMEPVAERAIAEAMRRPAPKPIPAAR